MTAQSTCATPGLLAGIKQANHEYSDMAFEGGKIREHGNVTGSKGGDLQFQTE